MSPAVRLAVLHRGIAALRALETVRRAALPPPGRPDAARLRALREIASLADALAWAAEIDSLDDAAVLARDAGLSMQFGHGEMEKLRTLAAGRGTASPYREAGLTPAEREALRALADLLERYDAGEFMPPPSYFGLRDPDA